MRYYDLQKIKVEEIKKRVRKNKVKSLFTTYLLVLLIFVILPFSKARSSNNDVFTCLNGESNKSITKSFGMDNEAIAAVTIPYSNNKSATVLIMGFLYTDQEKNSVFNIEFNAKTDKDFEILQTNEKRFDEVIDLTREDQNTIILKNNLEKENNTLILKNTDQLRDEHNIVLGITMQCEIK